MDGAGKGKLTRLPVPVFFVKQREGARNNEAEGALERIAKWLWRKGGQSRSLCAIGRDLPYLFIDLSKILTLQGIVMCPPTAPRARPLGKRSIAQHGRSSRTVPHGLSACLPIAKVACISHFRLRAVGRLHGIWITHVHRLPALYIDCEIRGVEFKAVFQTRHMREGGLSVHDGCERQCSLMA